jgi:hypothetical protein
MTTALEQIRQQYPQYNSLSDRQLADALYNKFYAGKVDKPAYYAKLGMTAEDRAQWGALESINNVVNQIGTGAYKGLAGIAGLPRTLSDLAVDRSTKKRHPVAGRAIPGADQYVKTEIDPTQINPGQRLPNSAELLGMLESGTQKGVDALGLPPSLAFKQAPVETTADRYLQAGGAGASGAFLPGGALPDFIGGTAGGLGSELAGDLTKGTPYESYARVVGAIVPAVLGSYATNKFAASNVEQQLSRSTRDATREDWTAAMQLQQEAAKRGTPITAAEAMAQVQGGNRSLMSMQRTVEQMPQTERQMGQFMAQRPGGNAAAMQSQLDDIAQAPTAPFEVGPKVQGAAQGTINDVRQVINAATEPAYTRAAVDLIPDDEFQAIAQSPAFQKYLQQVRGDVLLGPPLKDLPDNSVAVVNAVKKEMGETAENFSNFTSPTKSPERAMRLEQTQRPMVEAARESSPAYDMALNILSATRKSQLEPMERGAIGQLAKTDDWQTQARIILSDTPGSEKEVASAVKNIVARNPEAMPELLRMKLEDTFNKALPNAKGTMEQFRGANFAGAIEKNPQTMKSLEAAIKALPGGDTQWVGFRNLLKVFEAQGQRLPAGSPTSFNQQLAGELASNMGRNVKSLGVELWANWNIQRRSEELARILTDPEGVALLRQLALLGPSSAKAQQLVQGFYQGVRTTGSPENAR